ncbi:FxSxx-COOH cyclophane-containing RiPP peptide [Actinokineospora pegani]|uniref:FxSxx-COOH cyclophane-containing RiPP peptide n=1 Tax=Actinokineospora pegani TaxID=2654637 RepID=UPI0018D47B23|nr:FxSxx-COOH cyclophane-containing RiPP peptide [Actinokineospora pegani]
MDEGARRGADDPVDLGEGVPDLAGLGFAELAALPQSVLRVALARVLAEAGEPSGRFTAFQNSI